MAKVNCGFHFFQSLQVLFGVCILLVGFGARAASLEELKQSYGLPADLDMAYWKESYEARLMDWGKALAVNPCLNKGTVILAHTYMHRLHLCEEGRLVSSHPIAIGRKGINKRSEGDYKTPVGVYPLAAPRESDRYGMFIPVGYPTAEQRRQGYTGGAIGIHGPYFRFFQLWGFFNILFDWTQGCLAVGTDSEIARISDWVVKHPKVTVNIFDERYKQ